MTTRRWFLSLIAALPFMPKVAEQGVTVDPDFVIGDLRYTATERFLESQTISAESLESILLTLREGAGDAKVILHPTHVVVE